MENSSAIETDILIVGSGVVGLAAAIAFAQQGRQVLLVDSKKTELPEAPQNNIQPWDARVYALTPATVDWFKSIGVWPAIEGSRINAIAGMQLWAADKAVPLNLSAEDADISALGYIVENQNLIAALMQKLSALAVSIINAELVKISYLADKIALHLASGNVISANLLVAADGLHSPLRQLLALPVKHKTFGQVAIVGNFQAAKPHGDMARQWFLPHETLALLPLPGHYVSMVWSLPNDAAEDLLKLDAQQLAMRVQTASNMQLGALELASEVMTFPLQQLTAIQLAAKRVVLVGDAAHHIHPMAGQGLNLGLRDIITLAKQVKNTHAMQDIGELSFLRQYERSRKTDITRMNALTSGLDSLFAVEQPASQAIASWGLRLLNKQAVLKKWLIELATH